MILGNGQPQHFSYYSQEPIYPPRPLIRVASIEISGTISDADEQHVLKGLFSHAIAVLLTENIVYAGDITIPKHNGIHVADKSEREPWYVALGFHTIEDANDEDMVYSRAYYDPPYDHARPTRIMQIVFPVVNVNKKKNKKSDQPPKKLKLSRGITKKGQSKKTMLPNFVRALGVVGPVY